MSQYFFDASAIPPQQEKPLIPDGWQPMRIVASEQKATSKNDGSYLKFELEVIQGPHQGAKAWDQLNIDNPNQTAVRIAQERLSAYCHATGVIRLQDTVQLHGIPMWCKIGTKRDEGYDPANVIKAIKHINDTPKDAQPLGAVSGPGAAPPQLPQFAHSAPPAPPAPPYAGGTSAPPAFTPPPAPGTQAQPPVPPAPPMVPGAAGTFAPPAPPQAPPAPPMPPAFASTPPAPPAPPQQQMHMGLAIGTRQQGHVWTAQGWIHESQYVAPSAGAPPPPWAK